MESATGHVLVQSGKRFRVVLADARPALEGRRTLKRLIAAGIPTTYILLNSLSCLISVRAPSFPPLSLPHQSSWCCATPQHPFSTPPLHPRILSMRRMISQLHLRLRPLPATQDRLHRCCFSA